MSGDELAARLRGAGCVFAEDEAAMLLEASAGDELVLETFAVRRCAGEPLEQVVGWAAFAGLRVAVRPGVFVPRMRTQALVAEALRRCTIKAPLVVDLCCGSGALGLAFVAACPGAALHASDIDDAALACARENLAGRGSLHAGDLFAALPDQLHGRIDVLLANVPYVPTAELALLPAEARDHERGVTLDGGRDGLDTLRRAARGAATWLAPGAIALNEIAQHQIHAARSIWEMAGLHVDVIVDDELEATVLVATRN